MRLDYDIAIAGYGPVGQTLAILMGRLGHSVAVFERWPDLYPRPRAVHYDDEVARIFQRLGIAEQLAPITEPATTYEWHNARGQTLLLIDRSEPGPSGWPAATMFSQPQLERMLDETAKAVRRGGGAPGLGGHRPRDDGAEVQPVASALAAPKASLDPEGEERRSWPRYAIGCDGANSLVRERMDTRRRGSRLRFRLADRRHGPARPGLLAGVNLQHCDPARPTTLVSGGPGRRRWEWMLLPGESRAGGRRRGSCGACSPARAWARTTSTLERHTVYTFRARWAERWRVGRMLLAGDAAHLMPPFAGQGMCSGIRDAFTLAWHLDLVLQGKAGESTLDAYTSERRGHLQHAIALSVELGKVICITDEAEAAARDEVLLAVAADPSTPPLEPPPSNLGPGVHDGPPATSPAAQRAHSFRRPRCASTGVSCLLEDTLASGFTLYALDADPRGLLDADTACISTGSGASLVRSTSSSIADERIPRLV